MRGRSDAAAEHHGPQFAEPAETAAGQAASDGFRRWLAANPPPNLDDLIAEHGGYRSIPPAAWDAFDRAYADWSWRYRNRS